MVCCSKGFYGYAAPDWNDPAKPWKFHPISPNNHYGKFTHGLGVGDVNGDGRMDLLEKDGWWEQPASLAGEPVWKFHQFSFGQGGAVDTSMWPGATWRITSTNSVAIKHPKLGEMPVRFNPEFKKFIAKDWSGGDGIGTIRNPNAKVTK